MLSRGSHLLHGYVFYRTANIENNILVWLKFAITLRNDDTV